MTHHKNHHHHKHEHQKPGISIFNKVTIQMPVEQKQVAQTDNKEDGCTGCFKALVSCFKK